MPEITSPPSHSTVTPDSPRRATARSRVSTSGTIVAGSSHPARSVNRSSSRHASNARRSSDTMYPVSAPFRTAAASAASGNPVARRKVRFGRPGTSTVSIGLVREPSAMASPMKRSARSRAASSPRRYTIRPVVGAGWARAWGSASSQSGRVSHQKEPSALRASPRTASFARTCATPGDSLGAARARHGERKTYVRCQPSGTDTNRDSVAA